MKAPRDKNVVESSVGYASRQIIAALRNQKFFSIEEMNTQVWERMDQLNSADFKKKEGSRLLLFTEQEQQELLPLPPKPFELFERVKATVGRDYHIEFAKAFYSVPPSFVKSEVSVKASTDTVFIYDKKGHLITEHPRCKFKGQKSTLPEHIHEKHTDYLMWSGDYFLTRARRIGPETERMISTVLKSREFEVQSYRSCVGILSLEKKYGAILEQACKEANSSGLRSYKAVNTIAKTLKDAVPAMPDPLPEAFLSDENLNALYCIHKQEASDETF